MPHRIAEERASVPPGYVEEKPEGLDVVMRFHPNEMAVHKASGDKVCGSRRGAAGKRTLARRLKHNIYGKHRKTFDTLRKILLKEILPDSYVKQRWYSVVKKRYVTVGESWSAAAGDDALGLTMRLCDRCAPPTFSCAARFVPHKTHLHLLLRQALLVQAEVRPRLDGGRV